MQPISHRHHQYPAEIIRHAVWLYLRFTLSYRDVKELLAMRGFDISYETVRCWVVLKFGPLFAHNLCKQRPKSTGTWHLDEVVVVIQGQRMYLWRAVDSEGEILDGLVQRPRDRTAALKLMGTLLKQPGFTSAVLVTDNPRSFGAARRQFGLAEKHVQACARTTSREFASGSATTRAQDAKVQVCRLSPALPLHACCRPQQFQPATSPDLASHLAAFQSRSGSAMAGCDHHRGITSTQRHLTFSPVPSSRDKALPAMGLGLFQAGRVPASRGSVAAGSCRSFRGRH